MESVRNWVSAIAAISIVLSLLDAIIPMNTAGRFAAMCGCLILTFVVLSPLSRFNIFNDIFEDFEYNDISEYVEQRVEENDNLEKILIDNQMSE